MKAKRFRYLLEFIVFRITLVVIRALGMEIACRLLSALAKKLGPCLKVTKIAQDNIKSTIGKNYTKKELNEIINKLWDNFGRYIAEFPFASELSDDFIEKNFEIIGLDELEDHQKNNIPFILCLGHFANWDFVIKVLKKLYPKFGVIYRKANNPFVDSYILANRTSENIEMIPKQSGIKGLLKLIKDKYSIAILADQKMNDGIKVPFLGRSSMTTNSVAKISLKYDYPIFPCQIIRIKKSKFRIIIHPKIQYESTLNQEADIKNITIMINKIFESWILSYPEQWFWFHNRWKK